MPLAVRHAAAVKAMRCLVGSPSARNLGTFTVNRRGHLGSLRRLNRPMSSLSTHQNSHSTGNVTTSIVPRRLSPSTSLAALPSAGTTGHSISRFHSTPPVKLAPMTPDDPDSRNPSKAAIVAQMLKDSKSMEESNRDAKDALSDSAISSEPATATSATGSELESTVKVKPPLWTRIKHEIQHYYHGARLFVTETRISLRLLTKMSRGAALSRREHKQLIRTSADMFKLFPLAVFLIVPFMEFALPLALKIWPDMLPSTFESKFAEEEKRKKLLKVRLDMAKFLQETISEMSVGGHSSTAQGEEEKQIAEFGAFFKKYRATGQLAPTEEIVRVARKFDDETTLQHLSRPQLSSMCRFVGVNAFGTDDFLRFMLRKKMRDIRKDDKMIAAEGIESLDLVELAAACSARGIRTIGVSPARMRLELQQWIDLHLNHGIPSTILLLSRAFAISDNVPVVKHVPAAEALQATLQSLPEEMKEETRMVYSEAVGAKVDPREKLELLKKQEAMIAEELKQEEDEKKRVLLTVAEEEVKDAANVAGAKGMEAAVGKVEQAIRIADTARAATPEIAAAVVETARKEELMSAPPPSEGVVAPAPKPSTVVAAAPTPKVDTAALKQLGEALEVLVSPSAFAPEMDDLKEIKKDRAEYREDLSLVESLVAGGPAGKALETKAGTMLGKRLDDLLKRIDADLLEYDKAIGDKLNLLKPNEVGLIPLEQVVLALQSIKVGPNRVTDKRIEQLIDSLDPDGDGMILLGDVMEMSRKLQELEEEPLERAHQAALTLKSQLTAAESTAAAASSSTPKPPSSAPASSRSHEPSSSASVPLIFPTTGNGIGPQPPMSASHGAGEGKQHL